MLIHIFGMSVMLSACQPALIRVQPTPASSCDRAAIQRLNAAVQCMSPAERACIDTVEKGD